MKGEAGWLTAAFISSLRWKSSIQISQLSEVLFDKDLTLGNHDERMMSCEARIWNGVGL